MNYFIPDFQRFFVWTPERVKSLIDSLLKDVNNLFNIALLDFESNRDISVKAPSEYIKLENEEFQNGYDLSLSVKESHFLDEIDEDILITDNYKLFIEVRSRKIYDFFVKKYKKIA